jgi:choice-of-anchor B domain-containing protein
MTPRFLSLVFLLSGAALTAQVSRNCQLQSRMTRAGATGYAGVWGYVDAATGREFAIVGARQGTWIVETTNPTAPVERGFIVGPSSTWRELSSYRQYLYSVTEAGGGVQITSMVNPDAPSLVRTFTIPGWNNTHTVSVDQGAGKLYCNGINSLGMVVFDISADPTNPVEVGRYPTPYVHDCFVQHGFGYLACINSGQFRIVDVRNLSSIQGLSITSTPNRFTHNVWVNSTDTIAVTTDETSTGYMQVYDVTNKIAPFARGSYSVPNAGIHNVFIREDKVVHMSYYAAGYRGVDITNPDAPREIGYYDTANAWGCYPFQPSGNIYISDIPSSGGLFVVKLTCGVPERYGQGTAGSGGIVPVIDWHGGYARINNPTFKVEGRSMLGGATVLMLVGFNQVSFDVFGMRLLVDPSPPAFIGFLQASGSGAGNGTVSATVGIPNDPGLGNSSVYSQLIVLDPGAPQGLAATPGMKITICPN